MELTLLKDIIIYLFTYKFDKPTDFFQLASWQNPQNHRQIQVSLSANEKEQINREIHAFFLEDKYTSLETIPCWRNYIAKKLEGKINGFSFPEFQKEVIRREYSQEYLENQLSAVIKVISGYLTTNSLSSYEIYSSLSLYHPFGIILRYLFSKKYNQEVLDLRDNKFLNKVKNCKEKKILLIDNVMLRFLVKQKLPLFNTIIIVFGDKISNYTLNLYYNIYGVRIIQFFGSLQTCLLGYRESEKYYTILDGINRTKNLITFNNKKVELTHELVWNSRNDQFTVGKPIDIKAKKNFRSINTKAIEMVYKEYKDIEDCKVRISTSNLGMRKIIAEIKVNKSSIDENFAKEIEKWGRHRLMSYERPMIFICKYI